MSYAVYAAILTASLYIFAKAWRQDKLDAFSGFLFGGIYFFIIPALLTGLLGPIEADGLNIELFTGERLDIALFSASLFLPIILVAAISKDAKIDPSIEPSPARFKLALATATTILIVVFLLSGKTEGRHWADGTGIQGAIPNAIAVVSLALRCYIFSLGSIVLQKHRGFAPHLFAFAILDTILTGNRISVLYLGVALVISRTYSKKELFALALIFLPPVVVFAGAYPIIRGVLWSEFGGLSGIQGATTYALENLDLAKAGVSLVWNLFEAANLAVFQFIFDHFGSAKDLLYGQTVIIKPLSLFIPRSIWPDKPEGLGIRLGEMITDIEGLSLNSLMLGEFWANFGWFTFFFVFVIFLALLIVTKLRNVVQLNADTSRFLFFLAFASWRHEFNYFVFSILSGIAAIVLISTLEKITKRGFRL